MAKETIRLFMWGYQPHFRISLELHAQRVFAAMGAVIQPRALLVGVRRPGSSDPHPICVEPEDGAWPLTLFDGLPEAVERIVLGHPSQDVLYGDELAMKEKPERIRRDSVRRAVVEALLKFDKEQDVSSFCGTGVPIGNFYVVPVVQIPAVMFERFPPLREPIGNGYCTAHPSFVHAALSRLLDEAVSALLGPDPGRSLSGTMRAPDEILRQAAASFMRMPGLAIGDRSFYLDMFETFNLVSSLLYEGSTGAGRLLLANPDNPDLEYALRLAEPVPFREVRWARKILQMASADVALIADCERIHGLGSLQTERDPAKQDVFTIDFLDHYHWQLMCGAQVLLRSRYGVPALPQEPIARAPFRDTFGRLFPTATPEDEERLWSLLTVAASQAHGSMLVVAEDAAEEARRLERQGTVVKPTELTEDLLRRVSGIDGTIILDQHGTCHAIGVILDGPARPECTPSRGSRYNSGVRYVGGAKRSRMAIVVSDDHTIDVIPILRPRVHREEVEAAVRTLEASQVDDYQRSLAWLDDHRFYLDQEQCERVNAVIEHMATQPQQVGGISIVWNTFKPNPEMNETYFFPDPN